MPDINWFQIGPAILCGGAAGAILKQIFDIRRNRIQPIGYSIELRSVYDSGDNTLLNSQIILNDGSISYKFNRLYTGTIEIRNSGLNDFPDFKFGLTLPDSAEFVQVIPNIKDRHHIVTLSDTPSLGNQISAFDVSLTPFNRKDSYIIQFLATASYKNLSQADVLISSSHPIKLVPIYNAENMLSLAVEVIPGPPLFRSFTALARFLTK